MPRCFNRYFKMVLLI